MPTQRLVDPARSAATPMPRRQARHGDEVPAARRPQRPQDVFVDLVVGKLRHGGLPAMLCAIVRHRRSNSTAQPAYSPTANTCSDAPQVRHAGLGVQFLQHVVPPRVAARQFVTAASGSSRSPKVNARVGHDWTQAGWISPSRTLRPSRLGPVLGRPDPLDAERALLHHAAHAHRDVRVELPVQRLLARRSSSQLNRRTLYGQLFEQYRVPMQRL